MEESIIKNLDANMQALNRRFEDHEKLHAEDAIWRESTEHRLNRDRGDIDMLKQIHESQKQTNELISEVVSIAQETLAVVKPLLKAFRFVGVASVWIAKIVFGVAVIWHVLKLVAAKVAILWS